MYNRTLDIYKGTDNPITIQFKNQDQKPVNITGHSITGYIVTSPSGNLISNVSVTVSNATIGTASIVLTEELLDSLPENQYKIAFKSLVGTTERPLYADDNYGLWIEFNVKPGFSNQGLLPLQQTDNIIDLGNI